MHRKIDRWSNRGSRFVVVAILAVLVVGLAASSGSATTNSRRETAAQNAGKFTIVEDNNYTGNEWRVETETLAKAMATFDAPYKGQVVFKEIDSENDPSSQIATLNDIIATKPSAILMDASSPTALDGVIQKACNDHIIVVSFDQLVTNKCAYRVDENASALYAANASWLFRTLKGKGDVSEDIGLPGNPLSTDSIDSFAAQHKKYPGITVVGTYAGGYAPGPNESGIADLLAGGKTINGIYVAGGGSYGAIQALIQAHHVFVPICNYGDIGPQTIKAAESDAPHGLAMQLAQNPPTLSGYALEIAWAVLHQQSPVVKSWGMLPGTDPRDVILPAVVYNTNGIKSGVPNVETLPASDLYKLLKKSLPSDASLPFSIPQAPVTQNQVFG
jgi:ribose transport system substrate-binding protein